MQSIKQIRLSQSIFRDKKTRLDLMQINMELIRFKFIVQKYGENICPINTSISKVSIASEK